MGSGGLPQAGSDRSFHTQHPPSGLSSGTSEGNAPFHTESSFQLLCIPGLHSPHAKEELLPCCPMSPCPHVRLSLPGAAPTAGGKDTVFCCSAALLFSAACCASPGRTSRKHRASHDHGPAPAPLPPRCQGPPEGRTHHGVRWAKPGSQKRCFDPQNGQWWAGSGGRMGLIPREGSLPPAPSVCAATHERKPREKRKATSSTLERFTDVAAHGSAKVQGLLSSPRSPGRLTLVIFSRRQG